MCLSFRHLCIFYASVGLLPWSFFHMFISQLSTYISCIYILQTCEAFSNQLIIIGGDWNTTVDSRPVNSNIDTINMADIPSKCRSKWLDNLCTRLGLSDPYRHFYPDRREFTYIPNAAANQNRSRLDFFLVTHDVLLSAKKNTYLHSSAPYALCWKK